MPDDKDIIKRTTVTETVEYRRPEVELEDDIDDEDDVPDDYDPYSPRPRAPVIMPPAAGGVSRPCRGRCRPPAGMLTRATPSLSQGCRAWSSTARTSVPPPRRPTSGAAGAGRETVRGPRSASPHAGGNAEARNA